MGSPQVGSTQGKVWGATRLLFAWNGADAHLIQVEAGGYSSRHSHRHKYNRFCVVSGSLVIRVYRSDPSRGVLCDETIIGPGGVTDVPPGVEHGFCALERTVAVEFCWTVLDEYDIERHGSVGGRIDG